MELEHPRKMALDEPDKPAFIMAGTGETVTRLQLEERANQAAHLLRDLGLKKGENIAVLMENRPEFIEVCCAAARCGLFYTAISTHLTSSEVEYIVSDSGAKAIFTSKTMMEKIGLTQVKGDEPIHQYMVGGTWPGFESYEANVLQYSTGPIPDEASGRDMLYSSGTTGRPKGIKVQLEDLPYGQVTDKLISLALLFRLNEDSIYLSPAPLYHAAPLRFVMTTLRVGGTVVIMERFDELQALASIEKYNVTHSQWVPTMFVRMLKMPREDRNRFDLSSHKVAIHAAAPISVKIKQDMIDWWGPILFEYYAGTEGNGLCMITSEEWLQHKGSVGRSFIGQAHILDEQGDELPPGQVGTIYFSDADQFEYHNDPDKTAASRSKQGWTTISDVGYLDKEGYLYLTDRKSNMIISGGVNIYPQEAENVLINHPQVMDVAVIGVPNEEFGEEVKGVVQLRDMSKSGPELEHELMAYCRRYLSKIKCPVSIDFEDDLPRTPTGKLLKRLIRERYWQGQEGRI
jgi:acyl-CoA synthetase (AMP-forming)/AMP-acid ligase II